MGGPGGLGGGPEPLALILARVGRPHVLPSLHLLQTVLVHFPLGEDEEEDTTGEADGPRGGREMGTGFGQGPSLSQSRSDLLGDRNGALPLVSTFPCVGSWRGSQATALLHTSLALLSLHGSSSDFHTCLGSLPTAPLWPLGRDTLRHKPSSALFPSRSLPTDPTSSPRLCS